MRVISILVDHLVIKPTPKMPLSFLSIFVIDYFKIHKPIIMRLHAEYQLVEIELFLVVVSQLPTPMKLIYFLNGNDFLILT